MGGFQPGGGYDGGFGAPGGPLAGGGSGGDDGAHGVTLVIVRGVGVAVRSLDPVSGDATGALFHGGRGTDPAAEAASRPRLAPGTSVEVGAPDMLAALGF